MLVLVLDVVSLVLVLVLDVVSLVLELVFVVVSLVLVEVIDVVSDVLEDVLVVCIRKSKSQLSQQANSSEKDCPPSQMWSFSSLSLFPMLRKLLTSCW